MPVGEARREIDLGRKARKSRHDFHGRDPLARDAFMHGLLLAFSAMISTGSAGRRRARATKATASKKTATAV